MFRLAWSGVLLGLAGGVWWGCSPDSGNANEPGGKSGSGSGAQGGSGVGGAGASASGGAGGSGAASGGSSGSGTGGGAQGGSSGSSTDGSFPDVHFAYDGQGGAGGITQDSACASVTVQARLDKQPADIIIAVDNSGSMTSEAAQVQQNLNGFSSQIIASGIDVHVVLISKTGPGGNGICIAGPLGNGTCPNDSKPPNYLHIPLEVASRDGLSKFLSTYGQWSSMLRTNATKAFVIVTDDDSDMNAATFISGVNALVPPFGQWKFHGIFSYAGAFAFGNPCFAIAANEGTVYKQLVQQTGGISGDLCLQDFKPVFDQLATSVVTGSQIACDFPAPTTSSGVIDWDQVSIEFVPTPGGQPQPINRVSGAGDCANGGFYYDNPSAPTRLILCTSTCNTVKGSPSAKINVLLGCLGA